MNTKKISFVIPSYNSESTIGETIDSIFNNNFEIGDEIIIVNDFSRDSSVDVVKQKSLQYNTEIQIINNPQNIGCPASRNVGISLSKNDLIMSFDSDNILPPNTVKILKQSLLENNADIVSVGKINFFPENPAQITHKWIFRPGWFQLKDLFSGNMNPGPVGNYMFTKDSWKKVGGFEELKKGLHEAWIFTLKQLSSGSKIFIEPKASYFHRYGHESLTMREYKDNVESEILLNVIENLMPFLSEDKKEDLKSRNPRWIHELNKKPIKIRGELGKNGKYVRTLHGIISSIKKIWKKKN